MATKKVDADVYDGDSFVASVTARPIRLMPNRLAGVVYNGMVYPLYRGDFIQLQDEPVEKDECLGFVKAGAQTPYMEVEAPSGSDEQHLGIEDWYLESNRFGHYLVFDASEEAAERLVDAIEEYGLGVRRFDESSRPADDGHFYDWFIRLGFDGSRDECLRQLVAFFDSDADDYEDSVVDEGIIDTGEEDDGADHYEIAQMFVDASPQDLDVDDVADCLEVFDVDGHSECSGYLSWRYEEAISRPGSTFDETVRGCLRILGTIVRDDKALLSHLVGAHGQFLDGSPGIVERAIEAEFDKVDLDAMWWSPDDALRRARASLTFLRRAAVLAFGDQDYWEQLLDKVQQLAPPPAVSRRGQPTHVVAATENLDRMLGLFEDLFTGDDSGLGERYDNGQADLRALSEGRFDFLDELDRTLTSDTTADGDLPFEILPPGELVNSFIGELRGAGSYRGREIDLGRLKVLKRLEEVFSDATCKIHRGAFPSSGNDNLYVVLSLSRPNRSGEDAVAISPCKGEHATFVVRHDCGSRLPWRVVLAQTKREAKHLGARRLLFTSKSGRGIDVYQAMLEKLVHLLDCEPDEFDWGQGYFSDEEWPQQGDHPSRQRVPKHSPSVVERVRNWIMRR
ncbi:hypothetical protein [Mycobacterium sp. NAZ190054]|uniref:hypothetical protein n=1 Tax=Mycobacterium sp. NAZ190054 TaxID=1747766 RepID=UPI00079CCD07|nr:hypothetical protein [Mycobacterium sp. NAZ190054]KWX57045.1 hypothetical protein ASJ79_01985 [Mycobacterium sp. NAZ190054]